jgi:hypothetical protein
MPRLLFDSTHRRQPRSVLVPLLLSVAFALPSLTACDGGDDPVEPSFGVIEVTTLTEGPGPAPSSYTVLFNGAVSGTTGPDDVYTIPHLPPGQYVVALDEEPDRCFFGANARQITVEANETSPTTFLVRCDPED